MRGCANIRNSPILLCRWLCICEFFTTIFFYGRFVSVPPVSSVGCRRACSPSVFLALQRARVLCFGVFPCARREIAKILHLGLEETGSVLFRDHRSPRRADICFGLTNAVLRLGRSCLAATETLSWQVAAARSFPDTGQLPRPRFSVVRSYCGSSKWKHYICLPVGFFCLFVPASRGAGSAVFCLATKQPDATPQGCTSESRRENETNINTSSNAFKRRNKKTQNENRFAILMW